MSGYVLMKPEELKSVCEKCLEQIKNYNGEDDEVVKYHEFSWFKLKRVEKSYIKKPSWTYKGCGIITRTEELLEMANNAIKDGSEIRLSETTYINLYGLLTKSNDFQPYVYGMGH